VGSAGLNTLAIRLSTEIYRLGELDTRQKGGPKIPITANQNVRRAVRGTPEKKDRETSGEAKRENLKKKLRALERASRRVSHGPMGEEHRTL